jgi:hypothetical protein
MSQSDGEPAWQGKTYNALKEKKHLTGINKEGLRNFLKAWGPQRQFAASTYLYVTKWIDR